MLLSDPDIVRFTDRFRDDSRESGLAHFDAALAERLARAFEAGMRRLCALPLSDPFWYPSNMTPTPYKAFELAARRLRDNPGDAAAAAWTSFASAVQYGRPFEIVELVRTLLADDPQNLRWVMSSLAWLHDNGVPINFFELANQLAAARDADPRLRALLAAAVARPRREGEGRHARRAVRTARFLIRRR